MHTQQLVISETMEQVHKLFKTYMALHREPRSAEQVIEDATRERWGDVDPALVLIKAEANSLKAERDKIIRGPTNGLISTTVQGDLFHATSLVVPRMLVVDGKERPYYKASVLDGLAWWQGRREDKAREADQFQRAADECSGAAKFAEAEASKLLDVIEEAKSLGVDPSQVKYARDKAQED